MTDSTTNIQLDDFFSNQPKYVGTFSKDNLPTKKLKTGQGLIVNQDDSIGPGTHWVLLFKYRPTLQVYIDPFGVICPNEVITYARPNELIYSTNQIQDIDSSKCGYYCALILSNLFEGGDLYEVMHQFTMTPSPSNELKAKSVEL